MTTRSLLPWLALLALLAAGGAFLLLRGSATPAAGTADTLSPDPAPPAPQLPRLPAGDPGEDPAAGAATEAVTTPIDTSAVPALVTGRVIDRGGQPVEQAVVRSFAREDDPPFRTRRDLEPQARTDAAGRFRLAGLPPGAELGLEVEHPDHAPALREPFRVRPAADLDVGDIVLEPGLLLHGTVRDGGGQPLPGAQVELRDAFDMVAPSPARPPRTAQADAQGRYAFAHLAARQYALQASAEGHGTEAIVLSLALGAGAGEWRQDFTLQEAGSAVAGWVLGPDDQPVPELELRLTRQRTSATSYFLVTGRTDAAGRFEFLSVPDGVYLLDLSDDLHFLERPAEVQAGRDDHLVRALRGQDVHGRVLADPLPARFRLRIQPDGRTGAGLLGRQRAERELDDGRGTFELAGLRPGSYRFEVLAEGYAPSSSSDVILGPGQPPAEVLVELRRGGEIVGRLEPPDPPGRLELREPDWDPASPIESAFPTPPAHGLALATGGDGAFRFAHVPPGAWVLTLRVPGAPPLHLRDLQVQEGGRTDVGVLRPAAGGTLTGTVTGPDGRPRQGVRVTLVSAEHQAAQLTDVQGAFVFTDLPAGEYQVHATPGSLWEALRFSGEAVASVRAGAAADVEVQLLERPPQAK